MGKDNWLKGLVVGTAIGAGLGMLFAPEKGEVTRKKAKKELDKVAEKGKKVYKDTKKQIDSDGVKPVVENLKREVKKTSEAIGKEIASSIKFKSGKFKADKLKSGKSKSEKFDLSNKEPTASDR